MQLLSHVAVCGCEPVPLGMPVAAIRSHCIGDIKKASSMIIALSS
jgi:hypothetical protein